MQNILILFMVILISGCGFLEKKIEDAVKNNLTEKFFDPSSVQYRDVVVNKLSDSYIVCGEFNSKNRYGAYVGFKRFYSDVNIYGDRVSVGITKIQGQGEDYSFYEVWESKCKK